MAEPNRNPQPPELDEALRRLVLTRASAINGRVLARLSTVSDDLDSRNHLAALGGLDSIEREIDQMRSFLLLLS
ncbi:MAG: hypothetical protein ABSD39_20480 [Terriglobales bacterium]|jgi:hypothetical protein